MHILSVGLLVFLVIPLCHCHHIKAEVKPENSLAHTTYIYIDKAYSWNSARLLCQEYGGELINLKTREARQTFTHFRNEYSEFVLSNTWMGLSVTSGGELVWEDCHVLNITTNVHSLKSLDIDMAKRCYEIEHDTLLWKFRKCSDKRRVLCEVVDTNKSCDFNITVSSVGVYGGAGLTINECEQLCAVSSSCYSVSHWDYDGNCILVYSKDVIGVTQGTFKYSYKACYDYQNIPEGSVTSSVPTTGNDYPDYECVSVIHGGSVGSNGTELVLNITSPTPCSVQIETITEFNISVLAVTINVTETITETNILSAEAVTLNVTHEIVSTETMHVNFTINVTTTESYTEVHNITLTETLYQTVPTDSTINCLTPTPQVITASTTATVITYAEALEAMKNLTAKLSVSKKTTSLYLRSLVSATDDRASAVAIGYVGIVMLVLPMVLIFILDIPNMLVGIKHIQQWSQQKNMQT